MKNRKIVFILVLAVICVFFGFACQKKTTESKTIGYALNCATLEMEKGEETTLTITPQATSDIVWKSSDVSVVAVDENGKLTAKEFGTADVTATVGGQVLTCQITVQSKNVFGALFALDMKIPNGGTNSLRIFQGATYTVEPKLYIGSEEGDVDLNGLQCYSSDETVLSAKVEEGRIEIKGLKTGASELYATYDHEGTVLYSDVYLVTVDVDRTVYAETERVSLLTPYTVTGEAVAVGTTATPKLLASSKMLEQDGLEIDDEDVSWISADSSIVKVENNRLVSVASGDTYVTAVTAYGDVDIPVRVSYPISSAAELDFLSLVTYKENTGVAKAWLGANYLFTRDIDYSAHTRNYILPIASFNDGMNSTFPDPTYWGHWFHVGGGVARTSYYSLAWKSVLGLNEGGNDTNGRYLKNADATTFQGINPKCLWFTGRMDGNGYAIKNAWFMWDNYMGRATGSVYEAAHGSFIGLNAGTIENLEMDVKTPNNYVVEKNGKYSQGAKADFDQNLGSSYKTLNLLAADGTTVLAPQEYADAWGRSTVLSNESAFVTINNNLIRNVYYKVDVTGGTHGTGRKSASPGAFVLVNFSQIKDCVIDRDIDMVEGRMTTFNYAVLVGTNRKGAARLENETYLHANGGGNIQGCYVLASSTEEYTGKIAEATTVMYCYGEDNYDVATTDDCSKIVYASVSGDERYLIADYAGMISAAQTNGNLSEAVWSLDNDGKTVSMKKGLVTFSD